MIEFFVQGHPRPGGSKKAFRHPHTGKIIVLDDAKGNKGWREVVRGEAMAAHRAPPLSGPLRLEVVFYVLRPKGHYGSGRNAGTVRESAPKHPTVKPDATKLLRSTEDALTGVIWRDDAQVIDQRVRKEYGERPGALIRVTPIN